MAKSIENRYLRDEPLQIITVQSDEDLFQVPVEPFWKKRPDLWFKKIEAQLSNCNIDEDTRKYNFVISLLDEEIALEVKDIIMGPPDFDKYDVLKEQLITRITAKNEEEAKKRMMAESMGDRTPSEFYNNLIDLAGCHVRDKLVEEVWLECLPSKIKSVVECLKDYELDTLVTVADLVHKVFFSPPTEQQANTPVTSALVESLVKEVENKEEKKKKKESKGQSNAQTERITVQGAVEGPRRAMYSTIETSKECEEPSNSIQTMPMPHKIWHEVIEMRKNCN